MGRLRSPQVIGDSDIEMRRLRAIEMARLRALNMAQNWRKADAARKASRKQLVKARRIHKGR